MWFWSLVIIWLLGWCCIPDLLLLNKRPTATLAWLWALVLFPVLGPLLYLAIGSGRVKRRRVKNRPAFRGKQEMSSVREHSPRWWRLHSGKEGFDPAVRSFLGCLSSITALPVSTI